jgi:hypothetical protein
MLTQACSRPHRIRGVQPVLRRITQKRAAFLERTYRELGLAAEQAARHAPITYALYLGIGQLRRAWPRGLPGSEVDAHVDLAVPTLVEVAGVPPRDADEAIKLAGRDQAKGGSDERA